MLDLDRVWSEGYNSSDTATHAWTAVFQIILAIIMTAFMIMIWLH